MNNNHFVAYYHIIWATKYRLPLITLDVERVVISAIKRKSQKLGCPIHAVNCVSDHVHVAVTILPKIAPAEWIRNVKGLSTHEVNEHFPDADTRFKWQHGYSLWTFGQRALPFVVEYIERQKEHHANHTITPYLEYLLDE